VIIITMEDDMGESEYLTARELSRRIGVAYHRIWYAHGRGQIAEPRWIGGRRAYTPAEADAIGAYFTSRTVDEVPLCEADMTGDPDAEADERPVARIEQITMRLVDRFGPVEDDDRDVEDDIDTEDDLAEAVEAAIQADTSAWYSHLDQTYGDTERERLAAAIAADAVDLDHAIEAIKDIIEG